ncbi:hemicentin-2-like [Lingula anatina]|uniref:Hemicentin-2-like n=1 Tax=Lingula anatina TaxID=7574 RepID=A0A1S3HNL6_LINAN|nr:hemicentin-2-like [Lingula anatina]|eukprot:XP_013387630.1 hemicentin-2-like [Lingula anatina]
MGKGLLWRFTVGSMVLLGSILSTLAESPAQEVAVELGDDVQLNCSFPVTEGVIPSLNWQKQPKIIYVKEIAVHTDSRISLAADIPNGVYNLVISGTQLSDSGTYACVNQEGDAEEKLFSLKVQLRPTIEHFPEAPVTKVVGDGISLACNASGIPSPTITWRKGPQPSPFSHSLTPEQVLTEPSCGTYGAHLWCTPEVCC